MRSKKTRLWVRVTALVMTLVLSLGTALSLSPVSTRAATVAQLQDQLKALAEEEAALRTQLASYKNDVAKQQEYSDSIKAKITNSQEQIELLRQQIELLNEEMEEKSTAITQKEEEIAATETAIDEQFALFGERLRVISQSGNLSALQMIFNTEDYVDYLLKAQVVARIADNDQRMMDELERQVEQLDAEKQTLQEDKAALETQRADVEALKADADAKKAELDTLYAESNAVLKKLQASMNSVNADLAQKQKQEAALEAQIKQLLAGTTTTGKYTNGTMFWPVPTVRNISSTFGPRWGTMHRGIDIANGSVPIYGQNIVAAADGTVIFTNKSGWGGGYGLYTMINHGYDSQGRQIVTLYAHCSAILVNVGDTVVGGQTVIARAGSSGDVTGPHLHFEVRVNGTAVDPLANGYLSR